jgi:hypothetical protein
LIDSDFFQTPFTQEAKAPDSDSTRGDLRRGSGQWERIARRNSGGDGSKG